MIEWQPIKTAPKDKTMILLWVANGFIHSHVKTGLVYEDGKVFSVFSDGESAGYCTEECCTHWMPLPDAPKV